MKVIDTYNAIVGAAVAVLSYIFGEHWILFALFLAFNVADWITGWMKARLTHKENSKAGWKGVLKKLAYWIMIAVAFGASAVFVEIGKTLGVDLGITTLLGFFVLASLLVNEIRSICENLVEMGVDVPKILIKEEFAPLRLLGMMASHLSPCALANEIMFPLIVPLNATTMFPPPLSVGNLYRDYNGFFSINRVRC